MPNYYAQTIIPNQNGETADAMTNVFAVQSDDALTSLDASAWTSALILFYDAVIDLGGMRGYTETGARVKFLLADLVSPNYPLFENSINWSADPLAIDMPAEVALCVSYMNESETIVPRARRRGRIYLSGWSEGNNVAGRPHSSIYQGLCTAYQEYCEDINAIAGITAGVWSRLTGDVYPVESVWCDDEWDTMRSRGLKSTTRYSLSV